MPSVREGQEESPMRRMFETRSHSWRDVGLARQLNRQRLRRARIQVMIFAPLLAGILFVYSHRRCLLRSDLPLRAATVIALLMLGWPSARDLGGLVGPTLFGGMGPDEAGTVGLMIRL